MSISRGRRRISRRSKKKYGQPIEYWLGLVAKLDNMKHMERVAWLKTEHGMGHGHANAIVAVALAKPAA